MPIVHFLEENAIEYPNETAVVERIYDNGNIIRSEITWEEMNCRANRFAK